MAGGGSLVVVCKSHAVSVTVSGTVTTKPLVGDCQWFRVSLLQQDVSLTWPDVDDHEATGG